MSGVLGVVAVALLLTGCAAPTPLSREDACQEFRQAAEGSEAFAGFDPTSSEGAAEAREYLVAQQAALRDISERVSQTDKMFGTLISSTADEADGFIRTMQRVADGELDSIGDDMDSIAAYGEGIKLISESCRADGF